MKGDRNGANAESTGCGRSLFRSNLWPALKLGSLMPVGSELSICSAVQRMAQDLSPSV